MEENRIIQEMKELENKISYKFNDIWRLANAMKSNRIRVTNSGKNHDEHSNDALATVGDAILKAVIADRLFENAHDITKGKLSKKKAALENNKTLHKIDCEEGIIEYAYNDKHFLKDENVPDHEKVSSNGHDAYIEAIVAAIYYDSNFDVTKRWICNYLYPLLEKYKTER